MPGIQNIVGIGKVSLLSCYRVYLQEEPKEESDDDMGFSLFD